MILSYERQHYKTKCNSEDFGCKNSSVAPLFNIKIKICKTCQTFWIDSFFNLLIYSANSNSYFFLLSSFFLSSSVIFLNMSQMTQMSQMSYMGVHRWWVCMGVSACTLVCLNFAFSMLHMIEMSQIPRTVHGCVQVCAGVFCGCALVCAGVCRCARVCDAQVCRVCVCCVGGTNFQNIYWRLDS